jgi:hypothetical protein
LLHGSLLCLLFNPENGGDTFLQTVSRLSIHRMELHPRILNASVWIFASFLHDHCCIAMERTPQLTYSCFNLKSSEKSGGNYISQYDIYSNITRLTLSFSSDNSIAKWQSAAIWESFSYLYGSMSVDNLMKNWTLL